MTAPAPFALPPGAVTTAEFTFTGAFDTTTPRTVSGQFTFTGTANGQIVSIGQHKALIVVKPSGALPDVIRYSAVPFVRAVAINEDAAFDVIVTNTGGGDAIGCHVRGSINRATLTHWQLIEPVSGFGAAAHPRDAPFTIPAGQSRLVRVTRASQQSRIASPDFAGTNTAIVDCANTQFAPQNLSNNFDFTARGLYDPADVAIFSSIPGTGTLDVPAGSYSSFYVWFVNRGPTAQFVVTPHYLRPFDESDPAKQFLTSLCTANRFGECTSSPAFSSTFTAEQNVRHIYKIYVQAPPVDPGYDPGLRRILFKINQVQPVGFVFSVPVAAHSVAVRRN